MVAKFPIATNENYKDRNGEWQSLTEWHDIVVWRSLAERAQNQLKKGAQVYIEGKLTHRTWQDQDGNNRKTTEVLANSFRLLGRREGSGSAGSFPGEDNPYAATTGRPQMATAEGSAAQSSESTNEQPDDDLPF